MNANVKFKYAVGDLIEERNVERTGIWVRSVVTKLAPYRGRPGYYTNYDPVPMDGSSTGGWTYEACMRPRPSSSSQ